MDKKKALIIAEVAQSHDGSLGQALCFIDAAADAGVDAIKFQTHIADQESTTREPWRVKFSKQDDTRFDYWKRMEFTLEQWLVLKDRAHSFNLKFFSSPFSDAAVDLLMEVGLDGWKVASGEITNEPMLKKIIESNLPVYVSTGMSRYEEIDPVVDLLKQARIDFGILQCSSLYPTPAESVGLNIISELRDRYQCKVGISDHSGTIYPALAAAALGVDIVEVHMTLARNMFGPDVPVSVDPEQLKNLVQGVRFVETAIQNPVDKDELARELTPMRKLFQKSIVARTAIPAGTIIGSTNLALKKPGDGLSPDHIDQVLGRKTVVDIAKDQAILFNLLSMD